MARRNGKKGDYLATDDYTGFTEYRSKLKFDYWGNLTRRPMARNLQEIATPLMDPKPVTVYRGPMYEYINLCDLEMSPATIGRTNVPFPNNSPASQALDLDPAIPDMEIGCTFIIR